jgi:adenylate cyclase
VVRRDLARYVSPDVANALAARVEFGFGEPTNRVVAVMFADIVGFTKLTGAAPPEHAFSLLRELQERSCTIVFRHNGTLDEYLGDGFMATCGATDDHPDPSSLALTCAFDLKAEIERWNTDREKNRSAPVPISIGVHSGKVLVGNFGSDQRIEFTVVGDVVNVASRLEEATRDLGCTMIASEDCVAMAGTLKAETLFQRHVEVNLRGSSRKVPAYLDQ